MFYDLVKLTMCFLIVLIFPISVSAQNFPEKIQNPSSLDSTVLTGQLPNGLTYYILHNEVPKDKVIFQLTVRAGSMNEDPQQLSGAHLLEHLAFSKTRHFPNPIGYFESKGVVFGEQLNGKTGTEDTNYFIKVNSDDVRFFDTVLLFLRDCAAGIIIDDKSVEKEKGVVLAEIDRKYDGSYYSRIKVDKELRSDGSLSYALLDQRIGLKKLTSTNIMDFYNTWYRPSLQCITVVGNVNPQLIETKIRRIFAAVDKGSGTSVKALSRESNVYTKKDNYVIAVDSNYRGMQIQIIQKINRKNPHSIPQYSEELLINLFNQMASNRIDNLTGLKTRLSLSFDPKSSLYAGEVSSLVTAISSGLNTTTMDIVEAQKEIVRICKYGFTPAELKRAKQQVAVEYSDTSFSSQMLASRLTKHFSVNRPAPNLINYNMKMLSLLNSISVDHINKVASGWINKKDDIDIFVITTGKDQSKLPSRNAIVESLKAAEAAELAPFRDAASIELMSIQEINDLKPGFFRADTIKDLNIRRLILSNGISVLLRNIPKGNSMLFSDDRIVLQAFRPGGYSRYTSQDLCSAVYGPRLISISGPAKLSSTDFNLFKKEKDLSINTDFEKDFDQINGSFREQNIEDAMQLLYLMLATPKIDTSVLQETINEEAKRLGAPVDSLRYYENEFLGINSDLSVAFSKTDLNNISIDKALEIYKSTFGNPAAFTFLITGDFDVDMAIPIINKYLGSLKTEYHTKNSKRGLSSSIDIHENNKSIESVKIFNNGNDPYASLIYSGKVESSTKNRNVLALLTNAISSDLMFRLRSISGSVYSASANLTTQVSSKDSYRFGIKIGFSYPACDIHKLIPVALQSVAALKQQILSEEEFTKAVNLEYSLIQRTLTEQMFFMHYMSEQIKNNRELSEIVKRREDLPNVTKEDLYKAANELLLDSNLNSIISLPRSKCSNN